MSVSCQSKGDNELWQSCLTIVLYIHVRLWNKWQKLVQLYLIKIVILFTITQVHFCFVVSDLRFSTCVWVIRVHILLNLNDYWLNRFRANYVFYADFLCLPIIQKLGFWKSWRPISFVWVLGRYISRKFPLKSCE